MKYRLVGANYDQISIASTLENLARTLHDRGALTEAEEMKKRFIGLKQTISKLLLRCTI